MIAELTRIRRALEGANINFSKVQVCVTVHSLIEKQKVLDSIFMGIYPSYMDSNYKDLDPSVDGKMAGVSIKIEVLDRRKKDRRK